MRADEQVLGQYCLLERIGQGGMAEVYHARHLTAAGREVAIKIIRADLADNPTASRRFVREVHALSRLSHPHILSPLGWGEDEGRLYLVLPWVREGTLSHLLQARDGFLAVEAAVPLFGQLCAAVQYAHEQGIIHRDIKPQNVLVQHGTYVFLTDFGIALNHLDTRLTMTEGGLGSVNYMAPEQVVGQATRQSDLYSLGVVLYQLLTGVVPFSGDSPLQILLKQAYAPPPDPRQFQPDLPRALVQVLQTALAKDPGARFESVQALWSAVQPFGSASSQVAASAPLSVNVRPDGQPHIAARQTWSEWPTGLDDNSLKRDNRSASNAFTDPDTAHQGKRPDTNRRPLSLPLSSRSWQRLRRRQKVVLGEVITAALLLLVGSAVLVSGQPFLGTPHPGVVSQVAEPPPAPKKAVPTTGPSAPPPAQHARGKGHGGKGHGGER